MKKCIMRNYTIGFFVVLVMVTALTSCPQTETVELNITPVVQDEPVTTGSFIEVDSATTSLNLTGLSDNEIYLIKYNTSGSKTIAVAETGYITPAEQVVRYDNPRVREFNNNPPSFGSSTSSRSISDPDIALNKSITGLTKATVDSTTNIFYDVYYDDDENLLYNEVPATLRAVGDHCYVWVADVNYFDPDSSVAKFDTSTNNLISTEQAQAVAAKFSDTIYNPVTAVFGPEYGGSSYENLVDDSDKISIFIYDIDGDYASTQTGGTFGYFWSKDLYTDDYISSFDDNNRSNETEMFYIDANFLDQYEDMMYSTLAHEFQHMLHFVTKNIEYDVDSSVWFNEMLSMVCEDMMQSYLAISDENSPKSRLSDFNSYYNWGLTTWYSGDDVVVSYANAYAFGAYLARNYGGAIFIHELAMNDSVDMASITAALTANSYTDTASDAFTKWAQTLVYTEATTTHPSYNRDSVATVTGLDENDYAFTFKAIDLKDWGGPLIYETADKVELGPTSFSVHAISDDNDVTCFTGAVTLDMTARTNEDEIWYVLVK